MEVPRSRTAGGRRGNLRRRRAWAGDHDYFTHDEIIDPASLSTSARRRLPALGVRGEPPRPRRAGETIYDFMEFLKGEGGFE